MVTTHWIFKVIFDGRTEKLEVTTKKTLYCSSRFRQYYSTFSSSISVLTAGNVVAWSATAIPSINNDPNFPHMSSTQVGWITALAPLTGAVVCPIMGHVIQIFGLRPSMLKFTLPLVFGWILIALSSNFWMLSLGRFITGFCSGGMLIATPSFVAEIADAEIRGLLGYSFDIMCSLGQFYAYLIGAFASWRWQAAAFCVMPIAFYLLMLPIPESPRDLIRKGKTKDAKKALAWFRSAPSLDLVQPEFNSILEELSASRQTLNIRCYFSKSIWKPTLICMILAFYYSACGSSPIVSYTVQIFEASNVTYALLATNLVGIAQVVMACAAALFVDRVGRRKLLIISGVGMSLCFIVLAAYEHWETKFGTKWSFLPVAMVMLFIVFFSIGFGPIPWVLMGEVIPAEAKGYASCIVFFSFRITAFVILLVYTDLVDLIGLDFCFFLFALICLSGCVYVFFQVPETKQKTLAEIRQLFSA